ncbi:MAG: NAD-dependent epimerase/dehydratase family protein [Verrucomicrobia bacterium]|nr:MAG: NAD-dependent epimerase/dehydratase family protein [Verrucomicrobiota bacterium]
MKILVTGGAGYKGVLLTEALLEAGHEVTVLDNFMYGFDSVLGLMKYPHVEFVPKDIRNLEAADVRGYDVIYHLAGISGYPACEANPNSAYMINEKSTELLVSLLDPGQLLVYASTTSFYGDAGRECTEETPVKPVSMYGITKYQAEQICLRHPRTVALRFATVFGVSPKMRRDLLVNDFVQKAVQDRSLVLFDSASVRTFLHVRDAVAAYLMVLEKADAMVGRVFNVGANSLNHSKMEVARIIREFVEFEIIDTSLPDPDVRNFLINFDRIAALGFQPRWTLRDGVRELVKLYRFYRPNLPYRII